MMRKSINEALIFDTVPVYCIQKKEAKYLAKEVPSYLKHGISVSSNDVIFDVGANIGIFSLWLHLMQNQNLNIYAFEPLPPIASVLSLNAERHAAENITVIPFGLGKREEKINLT